MTNRRFTGGLGGTTAGPGTGNGGMTCGSPPEPGAGALLDRDCIFSFQPSGPRYNCGVASTVKTLNECQRLSPHGQKFIFFRTIGTDIAPQPGRAKSLDGVKNRYGVAEIPG
jgi:hypothetical protein